jgi:predicted  nucleic acid-binding Zn-ribbon protein
MTRDRNMVRGDNGEEIKDEFQQLRDDVAEMEQEVFEKRKEISALSVELSDAQMELSQNATKIESLTKKLEESTSNGEFKKEKITRLTEELTEATERIAQFDLEKEGINNALEKEKADFIAYRSSIDDMISDYQKNIEDLRAELEETTTKLMKVTEGKETAVKELNSKINGLTSENRLLTVEKEQLTRDTNHMVKALQITVGTTKNLLREIDSFEKKSNRTMEEQVSHTAKMKEEISRIHTGVKDIVENSEKRLKEVENRFIEKQAALRAALEESNTTMKSLQSSLANKDSEISSLQAENKEIKTALQTTKESMSKLEKQFKEEKESFQEALAAGPSLEEIEKTKEEERKVFNEQLAALQKQLRDVREENHNLSESLITMEKELSLEQDGAGFGSGEKKGRKIRQSSVVKAGDMIEAETQFHLEDAMKSGGDGSSSYVSTETCPEIDIATIERILRNSLVSENYYFSKESNSFTNYYPIDELFLKDLVNSFFQIGKELSGLLLKTKELQSANTEITSDTERFLIAMSQDILVKLEKSKEDVVSRVRKDCKEEMNEKVESTISQMNEVKAAELYEQRECFQKDLADMKKIHDDKLVVLNKELEGIKDEYEEEIEILQSESTQQINELQLQIQQLQQGKTSSSLHSLQEEKTGSTMSSSLADKEMVIMGGPVPSSLNRQNSISSSKSQRPTMVSQLSRHGTMRTSVRGGQLGGGPVTLESLSAEDKSNLKEQFRNEIEKEIKDKISSEMLGKHKLMESLLNHEDNEINSQMKDLFKSLPSKYQSMNLQDMRQEVR